MDDFKFKMNSKIKQQALSFDPCFRVRDEYVEMYKRFANSIRSKPYYIFKFNKKTFAFVKRETKRESYLIDIFTTKLPGILAWLVSDAMKWLEFNWPRSKISCTSIQLHKEIEHAEALGKICVLVVEKNNTLTSALKIFKKN